MMQNRFWGILASLLLIGLLAGCHAGNGQQILLLHTNDSHGSVLMVDSAGGMAQRATYIKEIRSKFKDVLLVDAGDINVGQPVSNLTDAEPDIIAYNAMGYDAMAIGNHEFDKSPAVLEKQMRLARFPFLASNIVRGDSLLGMEYLIREYEGTKIGLFGLTTRSTEDLSAGATGLDFLDEAETARKMVRLLRDKGAVVVIALTHIGFTEPADGCVSSINLAGLVDGIDIIVDGHSHSYIEAPLRVNNTWIVTAGGGGQYVGTGIMTLKDGRLAGFSWKPLAVKGFAEDSLMNRVIQPYVAAAEADLKTPVGYADAPFEVQRDNVRLARREESALGNLLADAMLWKACEGLNLKAGFALINSGGIRDRLPGGELRKEHVYAVLPFGNTLDVVRMKGSDIRLLFDYQARIVPGNGAFAQLSKNVRVVYNRNKKQVVSLTIDGREIRDEAVYYMVACDFITAGKDGYSEVIRPEFPRITTSMPLSDVLIDYIRLKGHVAPCKDGRILFAQQ